MKHAILLFINNKSWIFLIISCTLLTVELRADTLKHTVKVNSAQTDSFEQLLKNGQLLIDGENYIQALFAYEEGLTYSNLSESQLDELHHQLAYTCRRLQQYDRALNYLQPIIEKGEVATNYEDALSLKGTIYKDRGDFSGAFNIFIELLQYYEQHDDKKGLARINYDLGSLFYYQNNHPKALAYYQFANQIASEIAHEKMIFNSLAAMGSTYDAMDSLHIALKYNIQSLELAKELDYQTGIAYALHNLGSNYLSLGDTRSSQQYFEQSILIKAKTNDSWGIVGSRIALADAQTQGGNYSAAIENLSTAENLANEKGMQTRLLKIYEYFAKVYESTGQFKVANGYLKKLNTLSESFFNEETTKQIKAAQESYEIESRDAEIELLTVKNESIKKEQRLRNIIMAVLIAFAIVIGVVAVIIFRNLQRMRQLNDSLETSERKILEQMKALADSNESLENFAYVASHDLREPLRMMKSFSTILKRRYEKQLDAAANEYIEFIVDGAERMDIMLTSLLDFSRLGNGNTTLVPTDLSNTIFKAVHSLKFLIEQKNAVIKVDYDQLPAVNGNESLLGQLIQNLITNGVKFNRNEIPSIEIGVDEDADYYIFSIKDNGIGISSDNQEKIFKMFQRLHHQKEFVGTGIGLATCKKIVELHHGKIWVESELESGSTFYFTLSKANKPKEVSNMVSYNY
ncbi:MAG: ATP-binding protein [Saprospiraceae bacterium]